jgi:hypothetical protein
MMAGMITLILIGLLRGIRTHRALVLETLALRHQLAVLQRGPGVHLLGGAGVPHAGLSEPEQRVRPGVALTRAATTPIAAGADLPSTPGAHRRPDEGERVDEDERGLERASGLSTWTSIGTSLAASRLMSAAAARAAAASSSNPVTRTMRRS